MVCLSQGKLIPMKHILLILFTSLFLSSCHTFYPLTDSNTDLEVPIRNSQKGMAKIYFEGYPDEPYIEGERIGVRRRGINHSADLSNELIREATRLGFDAIIGIDKHQTFEERYTFGDFLSDMSSDDDCANGEPSIVNFSVMTGTPIKLVSAIDYLDEVLDYSETFLVTDSINKKTLETLYSYNDLGMKHAHIVEEYQKINEEIIRFDIRRLIDQKSGWEVAKNGYHKVVVKRRMRFDDWVLEKVNFKYDANGKLKRLKLTIPKELVTNGYSSVSSSINDYYKLNLSYHQNRISKVVVESMDKVLMIQDITYESDLISKVKIKLMDNPNLILERHYHYLTNEDLTDMLVGLGE